MVSVVSEPITNPEKHKALKNNYFSGLLQRKSFTIPVAINLVVASILLWTLTQVGTLPDTIDWTDFSIEAASALTSFVLFLVVCAIGIRRNIRIFLLLGLSAIEFGRLTDALDEVILMSMHFWSIFGDILTLIGEILVAFAAIRWIVMSNSKVNTDPLTQLYNRRFHENALEKLVHFGSNESHKFAVIALDLDNFKAINDTKGHACGDHALRHAAKLLKTCSRNHDVVSRVGGEEFELLVPVHDSEQAFTIAERIRQKLADTPPEGLDKLTASIGVAVFSEGDSIEGLRERADKGVYKSKKAGKNCVTMN